jgi:hypothetical protein
MVHIELSVIKKLDSMLFIESISSGNFKTWLIRDAENRLLLKFSALAFVISFAWLKVLYPLPNFMPPDSNSYLEAAFDNEFINLWAIGYSKFVRLVSSLSNSHFVLLLLQYILVQLSLIYFLFSIRYFFSPGKWTFRGLLAISILNPLLVHISNFVSSDALFIALSFVWLTQLFWVIYEPAKKLLFWHAVIVLLAFMVRFAALYYPFISIAVIVLSKAKMRMKLMSVGLMAVLLATFIGCTAFEYKSKTNTVQYSAFGGWQIASNALYGYAFAKPIPAEIIPARFRALHNLVNEHMESLKKLPPFLRPDNEVAVYYLWDLKSPLRLYMEQTFANKKTEYFIQWASMAPLYASYGKFLIKQYPSEFLKYYVWPNFIKYYTPPAKFMGSYNLEKETVDQVVVKWFGWTNNKLPSYYKDKHIAIAEAFPIVFAAINIVFVLSCLSMALLASFKLFSPFHKNIFKMVIAVWLINMVFSTVAAPIELRYQIFPMIFIAVFTWLNITHLILQTQAKDTEVIENKNVLALT